MLKRRLRPRLLRVCSRTCVRFAAGGSRSWQPAVSIPIVRARWTNSLPPLRPRSSRAGLPRLRGPISIRNEPEADGNDRQAHRGSRRHRSAVPQAPPPRRRLTPATRLAAMLKEALAANTIGGKVEDDSRWRAAPPRKCVRRSSKPGRASARCPTSRAARAGRSIPACSRRITERAGAVQAGRAGGARR